MTGTGQAAGRTGGRLEGRLGQRLASLACSLALTCAAAPAPAFDSVVLPGPVGDDAFFQAATCGAEPGGACRHPALRWPDPALTLAILPPATEVSYLRRVLLALCVDFALLQINRAGSGLSLRRAPGPEADIRLMLTDLAPGTVMSGADGISGPGVMGVGYTTLWWTETGQISQAMILISDRISPRDIVSVVLEEIFQATGPLFDIDSPAYEGVSILSQTSNATFSIAGQDARLLRWLYPPQPAKTP